PSIVRNFICAHVSFSTCAGRHRTAFDATLRRCDASKFSDLRESRLNNVDRRSGYWNKEKETMSAAARAASQAQWLARLIEHAWDKAPGVRRRLEHARVNTAEIRGIDDLVRVPVIKKSEMPDLQKADPPFGGFCTVPLAKIRKIFVSPGPIFEPIGPDVSGFHAETGLFAGGFRPGDVVINTFSYHLTPAAHELDESLNLIGCSV